MYASRLSAHGIATPLESPSSSVTQCQIRNTPRAIIAKRRTADKAARRYVMRMSYMQAQRCLIPKQQSRKTRRQPTLAYIRRRTQPRTSPFTPLAPLVTIFWCAFSTSSLVSVWSSERYVSAKAMDFFARPTRMGSR